MRSLDDFAAKLAAWRWTQDVKVLMGRPTTIINVFDERGERVVHVQDTEPHEAVRFVEFALRLVLGVTAMEWAECRRAIAERLAQVTVKA